VYKHEPNIRFAGGYGGGGGGGRSVSTFERSQLFVGFPLVAAVCSAVCRMGHKVRFEGWLVSWRKGSVCFEVEDGSDSVSVPALPPPPLFFSFLATPRGGCSSLSRACLLALQALLFFYAPFRSVFAQLLLCELRYLCVSCCVSCRIGGGDGGQEKVISGGRELGALRSSFVDSMGGSVVILRTDNLKIDLAMEEAKDSCGWPSSLPARR